MDIQKMIASYDPADLEAADAEFETNLKNAQGEMEKVRIVKLEKATYDHFTITYGDLVIEAFTTDDKTLKVESIAFRAEHANPWKSEWVGKSAKEIMGTD